MANQQHHVKCTASASLIPANLTASAKFLAYCDGPDSYLIPNTKSALGAKSTATATRSSSNETEDVSCISFLNLGTASILFTATPLGKIKCLDETGQQLLMFKDLAEEKNEEFVGLDQDNPDRLMISSVACDATHIFLGNEAGQILTLDNKLNVKGINSTHGCQVTSLCWDEESSGLISGDERGNVVVWDATTTGLVECTRFSWEENDIATTCLVAKHGYAVAGFSNGVLRFINLTHNELEVEVAAHTRTISAIDVHQTATQVAVVSEDTFLSVWSLPTENNRKVTQLLCSSVQPSLLTGVQYCGGNDSLIAITAYDSRFLAVYPTPNQ